MAPSKPKSGTKEGANVLGPRPSGVGKGQAMNAVSGFRAKTAKIPGSNFKAEQCNKNPSTTKTRAKDVVKAPEGRAREKSSKPARRLEHSLSVAFRDATETYRTTLAATLPAMQNEAASHLANSLEAARATDAANVQKLEAYFAPFTKPFSETRLQITLNRGTEQESKTVLKLSDRMTQFRERVNVEEERLGKLLQELEGVDEEIAALQQSLSDQNVEGYAAEARKLEAAYVEQRAEAEKEFAAECSELVRKMKSTEENYERFARKQRQQLVSFAQEQVKEMDLYDKTVLTDGVQQE